MKFQLTTILLMTCGVAALGQTKIDISRQTKGIESSQVIAGSKQGDGSKFQMFGPGSAQPAQVAVYDSHGNLITAGCTIQSSTLSCGEGTEMSTLSLGELSVNGDHVFVIHGAPDQEVDGCIVLGGQPEAGQALRTTGNTIRDEEGRTCAIMEWATSAQITNLDQIATRRYADLQAIPSEFPPASHAAAHRNGGNDEIATTAAQPGGIPKAGAAGTLDSGWLPSPSTTAIGGIKARDCGPAGQFVQSINTDASVTCANIPGIEGGGVASVGLVMPEEFNVAGSPITSSGSFTVSRRGQSANTVLSGPVSGGAAAPTFRQLEDVDLPVLTWFQSGRSRNGSVAMSANSARTAGNFFLTQRVTATTFIWFIYAGDTNASTYTCNHVDTGVSTANVNCYDVGIYDANGVLRLSTGPRYWATNGLKTAVVPEVTLEPGWYVVVFAGTGTARIATDGASAAGKWAPDAYLGTTTNGTLPGTVSLPAPSWKATDVPWFGLAR